MSLTLAEQQRRLHQAVTQAHDDAALLQTPTHHEPLLRIYQHAYRARLIGALRDNFGVLPRLMGDEAFDALALAYLDTHPSRHPSIRWFGDQLADFMASHDELAPHPAMADMARMEWALRGAFDAPDAEPLTAAAFADVPPEAWGRLVLTLHPSVQRVPLEWHIGPAWHALQSSDETTDDGPALEAPEPGEHLLIVWRPVLDTCWRSATSPLEAELLHAVAEGEPFGALCERAAQHVGPEQAATVAAGCLQQWVNEGLLAGHALAPA